MENILVSLRIRPLNYKEINEGQNNIWDIKNHCHLRLKKHFQNNLYEISKH